MKVSVVIAVDPTMSRIFPKSGIDSATNNSATTTPVLNSILRILKSESGNKTQLYSFLYDMNNFYLREIKIYKNIYLMGCSLALQNIGLQD